MVNKNNEDFIKIDDTFNNMRISSTYLCIDDYSNNEPECSKTSKENEVLQPKSLCCHYRSRLSSMDYILKNMHKRWSIID